MADDLDPAALLRRECDLADAEMRKWVRVPVKTIRSALDLDPAAVERAARPGWLGVLIDTAQDVLDSDGGYLAGDERQQIADALAAARDGAWATDTDGGGPLCSSCGIGHGRGECTPDGARHFAPYGSTDATCGETVPRRVAWDAPAGEYVDPRFTVRRVRVTCPECRWRLGLGPANDGETEQPVPDGRCANTMVVRCWAWCGREPEHEGPCEVGGITGRVQHAPVEAAARDGASCGARYCTTDDVLGPHRHRAGRTVLTSAAPTVTTERVAEYADHVESAGRVYGYAVATDLRALLSGEVREP